MNGTKQRDIPLVLWIISLLMLFFSLAVALRAILRIAGVQQMTSSHTMELATTSDYIFNLLIASLLLASGILLYVMRKSALWALSCLTILLCSRAVAHSKDLNEGIANLILYSILAVGCFLFIRSQIKSGVLT
ncbi:MAG: hypothetical protein EOP06_00110 [Proteobacteria bacterium]|nr:MAG: hypothetical protein EOP06_00110 [Pseudomonadota bacterium]